MRYYSLAQTNSKLSKIETVSMELHDFVLAFKVGAGAGLALSFLYDSLPVYVIVPAIATGVTLIVSSIHSHLTIVSQSAKAFGLSMRRSLADIQVVESETIKKEVEVHLAQKVEVAKRNVDVVMKVLHPAIARGHGNESVIPPAKSLDINPRDWVAGVGLLKPHVYTVRGKDGGTYVGDQYKTVNALAQAIQSGRLMPIGKVVTPSPSPTA